MWNYIFYNNFIFSKLIVVLKGHIDNACNGSAEYTNENILYKAMKSLQYCIRFIVRSRVLFDELYEGKDKYEFEYCFKELLQSIVRMMCFTHDCTLIVQGACLKYLPSTISDILMVFDPKKLR